MSVNVRECDGRMELRLTVTDAKRSVAGRKVRNGLKHPSRRVEASGADAVRYQRSGFPTRTCSQRIATKAIATEEDVRVNVSQCDVRMELRLTVTDVKRSVTGRKARYGLKHP